MKWIRQNGCLLIGLGIGIAVVLLVLNLGGPMPRGMTVARYQTKQRLKALHTALAAYQAEHGGYPIWEAPGTGGQTLYQELFGDRDGDGIPDPGAIVFLEQLRPPAFDPDTGEPVGVSWVKPTGDSFSVVDIWNEPFYFANFRPGTSTEAPNGGGKFNPTYDLWSLGNDPDPADGDFSMWIKNW